MDSNVITSANFELIAAEVPKEDSPNKEYFPIEIHLADRTITPGDNGDTDDTNESVDNEDDGAIRSTPPIYLPIIINPEDIKYRIDGELKDKVWERFLNSHLPNSVDGINVVSDPVVFTEDSGKKIYKTEPLTLARYGLQIVHVFGPGKITLKCLSRLTQDQVFGKDVGAEAEGFDKKLEKSSYIQLDVTLKFHGEDYHRRYFIPSNRGIYDGKQVQFLGRRDKEIVEVLSFMGENTKRVKYWYDNPKVTVMDTTEFIDKDGKKAPVPVNKVADAKAQDDEEDGKDEDGPTPKKTGGGEEDVDDPCTKPKAKKRQIINKLIHASEEDHTWFFAQKPCWGTIVVKYKVSVSEFAVLYDLRKPKRVFEITPGNVEQVGFVTLLDGMIREWGDLNSTSFSGLRYAELKSDGKLKEPIKETDSGSCKYEKGDSAPTEALDPVPSCYKIGLKLFNKVEFKDTTVDPIMLFATNGKRTNATSFTPKKIDFSDMPKEELPKAAIYELRRRMLVYPNDDVTQDPIGFNDSVELIRYVDITGKVTEEKLEKRKKSNE